MRSSKSLGSRRCRRAIDRTSGAMAQYSASNEALSRSRRYRASKRFNCEASIDILENGAPGRSEFSSVRARTSDSARFHRAVGVIRSRSPRTPHVGLNRHRSPAIVAKQRTIGIGVHCPQSNQRPRDRQNHRRGVQERQVGKARHSNGGKERDRPGHGQRRASDRAEQHQAQADNHQQVTRLGPPDPSRWRRAVDEPLFEVRQKNAPHKTNNSAAANRVSQSR